MYGETQLIPKSGNLDLKLAGNWRPIALQNTTYKLFTACIAHQLEKWMKDNNLLHGNQKSLTEFEGCSEHNLALNLLIEENKRKLKSTYITFLDIANVFPSVPIESIDGILERHNVNKKTINIIKELYRNCSTTYHVGNLKVGPITVHKGVRQGCPLSS